MSDWMKTCKEIGGPANVDLESCFSQKYGCEAFKKGECNFDGENVTFSSTTMSSMQFILRFILRNAALSQTIYFNF